MGNISLYKNNERICCTGLKNVLKISGFIPIKTIEIGAWSVLLIIAARSIVKRKAKVKNLNGKIKKLHLIFPTEFFSDDGDPAD